MDDAPLLGSGDAFGCVAEAAGGAQTHLDEDQGVAIQANEVDFAATATQSASEYLDPVTGQ